MTLSRRAFIRSGAAASGLPVLGCATPGPGSAAAGTLGARADKAIADATVAGGVPGMVGAATTGRGTVYSGASGARRQGQGAAMDADTVMFIASMTKPLTSLAALQLVERGKLSLDEPASKVLPELAKTPVLVGFDSQGAPVLRPPAGPVTLRQLLTHTSGFVYDIWDAALNRYYTTVPGAAPLASGRRAALQVPIGFDPGTRWEYGIGIDWVGLMVEAASGQRLGEYFQRHITGPLGMDSTDFRISTSMRSRLADMYTRGADGALAVLPFESLQYPEFESGGAGLYSTANDYLKFLRMILNKGVSGRQRIATEQTVGLMSRNAIGGLRVEPLRAAIPFLSRDAEFFPGVPKTWSLAFMVNEGVAPTGRSAGSLSWAGLANTYFWIDPARDIAGLTMTQLFPFADPKALTAFYDFETSVYQSLG